MKGRSGRKERGRERTKKRNGEKRRTGDSQDERGGARERSDREGAPGAKEGRREEWFTCIASIALAQGQRVCETKDQTGSGPPSFQFPAPCSLAALLPLSCFARHLTSLSFLFRSSRRVPRSAIRKQLHHARALPLSKAYYRVGGFSRRNVTRKIREMNNNVHKYNSSRVYIFHRSFIYIIKFI